jgi:hypothetical protein
MPDFFSGKGSEQDDDRCYQQQVNQAVSNKASIKPNQPEQQQHYKNCPQHESDLLTSNVQNPFV